MQDMHRMELARLTSIVIAYLCAAVLIVVIGFSIENVDQTPFPYVLTVIFIYIGTGMMFMLIKDIYPPLSEKIQNGAVDLIYGFRSLYWSLWWPKYCWR